MNFSHNFDTDLEEAVQKEGTLPVLSPEALKIQEEATKKEPHFSRLAGLIRKDPVLTGKILKIANSPFYRGLGDAETLKDALTRMGQDEMVHIIMAVMHRQNFRSGNPLIRSFQNRIWNHAVNCALGTLWTARHLAAKDLIPKAFIAGLLHDMGKLHVLTAAEGLVNSGRYPQLPYDACLEQHLKDRHAQLGYELLAKWQLPDHYRLIARDHHCRDFDASDTLLVIVRLVNQLCRPIEKGRSCIGYAKAAQLPEIRILNLSEPDLLSLEAAIKADMALR